MPYGVTGNTAVFGTVILGSNPGKAARCENIKNNALVAQSGEHSPEKRKVTGSIPVVGTIFKKY